MIREFAIDINIQDANGNIMESDAIKHVAANEADKAQIEYETFLKTAANFRYASAKCPNCQSRGEQKPHAMYARWLITREGEKNIERRVRISRTMCGACEKTHAVLPDTIIPYFQHSLMFILEVLWKFKHRQKNETVRGVCAQYDISTSTLYEWRSRFKMHIGIDLGEIANDAEIMARYWPPEGVNIGGRRFRRYA